MLLLSCVTKRPCSDRVMYVERGEAKVAIEYDYL